MRKKLTEIIRQKGIDDELILKAINTVPRHLFMDSSFINFSYSDQAFPIGNGQTISQPYTVAVQTQLLDIKPFDKVLEITGNPNILSMGISLCTDGGWMILIGIPSSKVIGKMEILDTKDFILSEKILTGSEYFLPWEFKENLSLLQKAK